MSERWVLVGDADESLARLYQKVLRSVGLTTVIARDGPTFERELRARVRDLVTVVLDGHLLESDLTEILAEVRIARPRLPFIIVSGASSPFLDGELDENVWIVKKPFRVAELRDQVQSVLQPTG